MKHVIITGSSRGIGFGLAKTIEIDEDILPRELPSLSSPLPASYSLLPLPHAPYAFGHFVICMLDFDISPSAPCPLP